MRTMRPLFRERLQDAAEYAGVEFSPTAIGRALGVSKQTVHVWMTTGEPRPAMLFHIADTWQVDPRWLATGDGSMVPPPSSGTGLSSDEIEMIKRYRKATPKNRPSIIAVAKSLAKVAGLAALVVSSFGFNNNSFAGNSAKANFFAVGDTEYTLRSNRRREWLWRLLRVWLLSRFAVSPDGAIT